jgi:hypothetical protein
MERALGTTRGRLAAFAAVLALVLQALAVAPVHAGSTIVVCTAAGKKLVHVAEPLKPADHARTMAHCGLCILMAPVDSPVTRLEAPVRYAVYEALVSAPADAPPASARGPPRPFGQGPPLS